MYQCIAAAASDLLNAITVDPEKEVRPEPL